jgi:hypothetical protein
MCTQRITLNLDLMCETLPQAVQAVKSGYYASVLPTFVRDDLLADQVIEVQPAEFTRIATKLSLAWQKRTIRVRLHGGKVMKALVAMLRIG